MSTDTDSTFGIFSNRVLWRESKVVIANTFIFLSAEKATGFTYDKCSHLQAHLSLINIKLDKART